MHIIFTQGRIIAQGTYQDLKERREFKSVISQKSDAKDEYREDLPEYRPHDEREHGTSDWANMQVCVLGGGGGDWLRGFSYECG